MSAYEVLETILYISIIIYIAVVIVFVFYEIFSIRSSSESDVDSTTYFLNNCVCELSEHDSRIQKLEQEIENIKSDKTEVED